MGVEEDDGFIAVSCFNRASLEGCKAPVELSYVPEVGVWSDSCPGCGQTYTVMCGIGEDVAYKLLGYMMEQSK
jgi:hypothetical protein